MRLSIVLPLLLLFISLRIFSQKDQYTIDTLQLRSDFLKENRSIIIYKPNHISATDSVMFIYILDGEFLDYRFRLLQEHYMDTISNIIAVGIINTDRRRDMLYSYGADKFLDFVTLELIPFVETDCTVKSRSLFGHSFAGAFTIYALLNKPAYFDCYVASSPTPIMGLIHQDGFLHIDSICKRKILFYHSHGSEDIKQVRKWSEKLRDNITGINFKHLEYRFTIFEGKNHNNSDNEALLNLL
jgi:enterochelin esterase-like enzyme